MAVSSMACPCSCAVVVAGEVDGGASSTAARADRRAPQRVVVLMACFPGRRRVGREFVREVVGDTNLTRGRGQLARGSWVHGRNLRRWRALEEETGRESIGPRFYCTPRRRARNTELNRVR